MKLSLDAYLKLRSLIDELIKYSEDGAIIIVEGKNDVKALRMLGVKGEIVTSANCSNAKLVDKIRNRNVIILTDWDRRGDDLEKDLVTKFSSWGVVPDTELRRKIFSIVGRTVTSVEDLVKFIINVEENLKI